MLNRRKILKIVFNEVEKKKVIVITTTGLIGREAVEIAGDNKHFYMAGSMGLAASIGLGIAISKPNVKVISIDGDGSFLMNLGEVCTIGNKKPENLIHIVLDNRVYYSTGGMKTYSPNIKLEKITKLAGYKTCWSIKNEKEFVKKFKLALKKKGPIFMRIFIEPKGKRKLPRPKNMSKFYFKVKKILRKWEIERLE